MPMKKLSGFILAAALCASCSEDETTGTPVFISTDIPSATVYSNTIQKIKVEANSIGSDLSRLEISSFDNQRGDIKLVDSLLPGGKQLSYDFLYRVPMLQNDSTRIKLSFEVTDEDGFTQKQVRTLRIVTRDYTLEEVAGITLYTDETGDHANGLDLDRLRPLIVSLADSADIDIYTYLDDEDPATLSQEWRSNTDIYFARANNFDYANATNRSVTETFGSAVANPRISHIEKDDIILVGHGNRAAAAIKVVQMYDEPGTEYDRYIINVKRIREQ